MRKLDKPSDEVGAVFVTCISTYREPVKSKLTLFKEDIERAAKVYDYKASKTLLYTIVSDTKLGGKVTKEEMTNVYNHKMARKDQPGRAYYDKIFTAPAHGLCPLCGYRIVTTLDHYLPESRFPIYAVTPSNLIPSCFDCNKIKTALVPTNTEEETLHPYFDNIEKDPWLIAEVSETSPVSLLFKVKPQLNWPETLAKRVKYHFKMLQLSLLYGTYAAGEILNMRYKLDSIYKFGGSAEVKKRLVEDAESCEHACINSWQTAMYKALSNSAWFHSGGFKA